MARISRRRLAAGLGAMLIVRPTPAPADEPRAVHLYNVNTGESFNDAYHNGEGYLADAWDRLNWFLRDHHEDRQTVMDPAVFDLLWRLQNRYLAVHGRAAVININSAYRTERTNATRIEGSAQNSFHKYGKAVDVTAQGFGIFFLADRVREIGAGGVGVYWRSRFAHIDTGPSRSWYQRV